MAAELSWGALLTGNAFADVEMGGEQIVEVASGDWYAFTHNASAALLDRYNYRKSTDRGRTWTDPISINGNNGNLGRIVVWYDRWTPGDTGNLIHIAMMVGSSLNDVFYRNLDVSSDTLSTTQTVFNGVSFSSNASVALAIVKTKAANIYIAFDGDGGTETGHYVAASPFSSWTSKSNPNEASTSDWYVAMPGNYADTDDYDLYFLDRSANGLSVKTYDASGDSWSEATIVSDGSFTDAATVFPQFSAAPRHSDGHHIVCGWNDYDTAGADLLCYDVNGSGSIVAKTNVVTNADDAGACQVMVDQATDDIYVFYLGKSDGSQTIGSDVGVYYKVSTDDGSTWGAEQTLFNFIIDDFRGLWSARSVASMGVAPPVIWMNDDNDFVYVTAENPDTGGGGGGTSGGWWGS